MSHSPAQSPSAPIAFVAGATGYTGRAVVRTLAARGVRTIAHVRPDSPRLEEWRRRFAAAGAEVDTTPWDEAAMRDRMRAMRPTIVFALLGTTRARARAAERDGGARETYDAIDYGLTSLLLGAVQQAGISPRFVYLSAIGVREGARNAYVRARARMESELRASSVPWTIARPSFITGPDRDEPRPLERAAAGVIDGVLTLAGALGASRLRDRYASITGEQLADGLVRAALDPSKANREVDGTALRS